MRRDIDPAIIDRSSSYWGQIEKQQRAQRGNPTPPTEEKAHEYLNWMLSYTLAEVEAYDAHLETIGWSGALGKFVKDVPSSIKHQDAEHIWDRHIAASGLLASQNVIRQNRKLGLSYIGLAVKVQEAVIKSEDALNPQKVFWFSQNFYRKTRYTDAPILGLCGWVLRRCKMYPRIREALKSDYTDASQGMRMELPAAVAVAISEIGFGEGFGNLVPRVAQILEKGRFDVPDYNTNTSRHTSLDSTPGLPNLVVSDDMIAEFEAEEQYRAAVQQLTSREQDIMKLVRVDWEDGDIADALCVTVGTVKQLKHRAREKLKILLKNI